MPQNALESLLQTSCIRKFSWGSPTPPDKRGIPPLVPPPPPTTQLMPSTLRKNGYDVPWPYHFSKADDGPVRSNITLFGRSNLNTNRSFFLLPRVIRITLDGQNLPVHRVIFRKYSHAQTIVSRVCLVFFIKWGTESREEFYCKIIY